MTRLFFLLIPVLLILAATARAEDLKTIPVIDCHVHLWDTSRSELTWPREEHVRLYKPFLAETHAPICRANALTGVVVILSGQAPADNQGNLDVTAHDTQLYHVVVGNMSKAIGTDHFRPLFTRLCQDQRYVGYRLAGQYQQRLTDALIRDLRLTAQTGRTVNFPIGGYSLSNVDEIAGRIPELRIVNDHTGGVQLDGGPHARDCLRDFRTIAKRPNVNCRLSALYGRFQEPPAPTNITAYRRTIDLALKCFGEDRLIYGSDWPVTTLTGNDKSVISLTKAYFADREMKNARKVFHDNAVNVYGIPDHVAGSSIPSVEQHICRCLHGSTGILTDHSTTRRA